MISQSDIQGRLRLLRYGLIVVVVVSFLVSLFGPYAIAAPYAAEINRLADAVAAVEGGTPTYASVQITDFLGLALSVTVAVAVVAVVIYFGYSMVLQRTVGGGANNSASTSPARG